MAARSNFKASNNRNPNLKYVPKTQPNKPNPNPNPPSTLSSSLRSPNPSSSNSNSISYRGRIVEDGKNWVSTSSSKNCGNFVNYLPQDEAVAVGLGAEDGALDAVESQRVVDLNSRELSKLLKLNPKDFWKQVVSDTSLHDFLDSFLQFRSRWYDFYRQQTKGSVAGVIVGEFELSRRVFVVFYRISSNRDPGARPCDSLSAKEHGALLQEKKLLDLPKLLDICAIYGHENEELTRILVTNAMKAQPWLHENLSAVVSHLLGLVDTMYQRSESSLEAIVSPAGHGAHRDSRLHLDFLEVMEFINDAVASLDAFVNAYKPAALYFSCPVETSYGSGELLSTLTRLHDVMLPSLQRAFLHVLGDSAGDLLSDITTNLLILSTRIANLAWKLLEKCYLSSEVFEGSLPFLNATKMFPANVVDPVIRGDILVQTFKDIDEEASRHMKGTKSSRSLLRNVEKNHMILNRLDELRRTGWVVMENDQSHYLTLIMTPSVKAMKQDARISATVGSNKIQMDENAAITESKISQIKDIFPDYGTGFLSACLEAYNQNPEEVIQRILEGTLHEELQAMDTSLDKIPTKTTLQLSKTDKGKGTLVEVARSPTNTEVATIRERQTTGTSSSSSSLVGRYTRKAKDDSPNSKTLDLRSDEDLSKTLTLASQYEEYEDEYDDSFDELGISVGDSGYEEDESVGHRGSSGPGKPWGAEAESSAPNNSGSRWKSNTQKKPQFFVKDGKNYSYKVAGSVAVNDSREAALVNLSQKEVIHGLGRGGNFPLGAVRALQESNEQQDEQDADVTDMGGRGNFTGSRGRGRGRRGGGGSNFRKDRAAKKHFAGLGGY